MAEQQTIGKLLVRLLLDNEQMKKGLKDSEGDIKGFGGNLDALANKVNGAVVGAFKAATATIVGFGAASTVVGAQFEQAITTVGAVAGATEDQLDALEGQARKLGATTAFSATQAAGAMQNLARAGQSTAEIIATSESALLLAGAGATSMENSSALLVSTLAQFQLGAAESSRVSDVFSTALRKSQFNAEGLASAMKFAGTVGSGFGMTLEQTTAAVAQFRNLGLQGSQAGTQFRMALSQAAKVTGEGERALKKYGLTAKDINPELNSFAEIMMKVGEAGISTTDALEVFGTRAGANVAKIARQFADGSSTFNQLVSDMENSAGSTQELYDKMMDTVSGQFKILKSAVEELMISTFDQFKGPLKELLTEAADTVAFVAKTFNQQSGGMAASIKSVFGGMTKFLQENRAEFAVWFRMISTGVGKVIQLFALLAPILDNVAAGMVAIFVATKVFSFVKAMQAAVITMKAFAVATTQTAASASVLTGGMLPLAAAITAAVLALGAFAFASSEATKAANRLREAEEELAAEQEAIATRLLAAREPLLEQQKEAARLALEEKSATGELTEEEQKRLERLLAMNAAQAEAAVAAGELIDVDGELLSVEDLLNLKGNEGVKLIEDRITALRDQAAADADASKGLAKASRLHEQLKDKVTEGTLAWQTMSLTGLDSIEKVNARLDASTKRIEDNTKAADTLASTLSIKLGQMFKDATDESAAAQGDLTKTVDEEAKKRVEAIKKAHDETLKIERALLAEIVKLTGTQADVAVFEMGRRLQAVNESFDKEAALFKAGTDEWIAIEERRQASLAEVRRVAALQQSTETDRMLEQARAATETAVLDETALRERERRQQLDDARAAFDAELALLEAAGQSTVDAIQRRNLLIQQLNTQFRAEDAAEAMAAQRQLDDELASQEFAAAKARATQLEAIEMDRQKALRDAEHATQEQRARINQQFDGRIEDLKKTASERAQDILLRGQKRSVQMERDKARIMESIALASAQERAEVEAMLDKEIRKQRRQEARESFKKVTDIGVKAAKTVAAAFGTVKGALTDIGTKATSVFTNITGFSFNLMGAVQELIGLQDEATELDVEFNTKQAARDLVDGLITGAERMIDMLVEAAPVLIRQLVQKLPDLVAQVAEAIPELVDVFVRELPRITQAIAEAIPVIVQVIVEQLPRIVQALVDSLPVLFEAILAAIPDLVAALTDALVILIDAIPGLIDQVLKALPDIIMAVTESIPDIIRALVRAIPEIIASLIEHLPAILHAIIESIPIIVMSLVRQLPKLVVSIIEALPLLFTAIASEIPFLITTVIGLIPAVIIALATALPDLIPAIVMMIPTIWVAIIKALPEIVMALVEGIIVELVLRMPEIVIALVEGIMGAVLEIGRAIGEAILSIIPGVGGDSSFAKDRKGIGKVTGAIGDAFKAIGGLFKKKNGGGAFSGIDYVPATMRITVHPGERIVPAGVASAETPNRQAEAAPNAHQPPIPLPAAAGGGETRLDLAVMVEGQLVDAAMITAMDRGHAPKLKRRLKKASGITLGFNRGRANPWVK